MSDAIVRLLLNTSGFDSNLQRTKGKMRDFSNEGGSMGGVLKALGGNIAKLCGGLTAAGAALKVATDAFRQNESNIDEWGRTVEGAKGAYNTFLDTLNGGNWSNFFTNLDTAITGARELYNALDRLGSVKANNEAAIAIVQSEIQKLKLLKQQGQNVDDQLRAKEDQLKRLQMQSVEAGKTAGRKQIEEIIRSAYQTQVGARHLNQQSLDRIVDSVITQGQSYFDRQKATYDRLLKKGTVTETKKYTSSTGQTYETTSTGFKMESLSRSDQIAFRLAKAVTEGESRIKEGINIFGQAVKEESQIFRDEFKLERFLKQGGNGNGNGDKNKTPEPVYDENARTVKAMSDNVTILTKQLKELDTTSEKYRDTLIKVDEWQSKLTRQKVRDEDTLRWSKGDMGRGIRLSPEMPKALTPEEAQKMEKVKLPSSKNASAKADDKEQMGAVKDIVAGVDGIVSSLETLGVDVPSGMKKGLKMIQTVITILEAVKAIQSAVQILTTGRDSVYQAAVVSELGIISAATVTTAGLQTVKSVPIIGWLLKQGGVVHAAGGVVMGQNYIDRVPASLSSGEMVLNPAQQTKLFKMANEGGGGGAQSQPYVNAETIVLGIQNWAKRRGKGSELMFTQR